MQQTGLGIKAPLQPLEKFYFGIPEPIGHQLLIKVIAAGLNPADARIQKMDENQVKAFIKAFPTPLGFEASGIVIKRGEAVVGFPLGSLVFSAARSGGGLAEFTIVDSRFAAIVPANFSPVFAGGLSVNGNTTALALFSANGLGLPFPKSLEATAFGYGSKSIAIIGGGTGNGKIAIQLARIAGFGKIIAIASASGANELLEFGATHVVDRNATNIESQVREIAGDKIMHIYETIGRDPKLAPALLSNECGGTIVHIIPPYRPDIQAFKTDKVAVKFLNGGQTEQNLETASLFWRELPKWLENGDLNLKKVHVVKGLDIDEVTMAFEKILTFSGGVKYIVQVSGWE